VWWHTLRFTTTALHSCCLCPMDGETGIRLKFIVAATVLASAVNLFSSILGRWSHETSTSRKVQFGSVSMVVYTVIGRRGVCNGTLVGGV